MEAVTDFIFLGSKITADDNYSHEIKRRLLLGRKTLTNLDSILKIRDITLPPKVHLVNAALFQVIMYGCESCTIKKAEQWRIDAFELWCWRKLLRVPWTARRYNQSILKKISPEYSLEGLMLKLKLRYFGHVMGRTDSFEKTLMLGKIEGGRRRKQQRIRWLDGITDGMDLSLRKLLGVGDGQGGLACCSPWGRKESDTTDWLNWTELILGISREIRTLQRKSVGNSLNFRIYLRTSHGFFSHLILCLFLKVIYYFSFDCARSSLLHRFFSN